MNTSFWSDKNVLVTGGAGFIGSHLVETLAEACSRLRVVDSLETGDLGNIKAVAERVETVKADLLDFDECKKACRDMDIVLNLAAKVAGVSFNETHSADMFRSNVRIGMNMLDASRLAKIDRFLNVSSACVYSRNSSVPTPENEGFLEDPEPSNLGYGWAKRVLEVQGRLYAQQYGMKVVTVRPFNSYGPRDHFDLEMGHVIPSLVKKVVDGQDPLVVWGDGSQTRSFIYVMDTVAGMILAAESSPVADPINLGSDEEISIGELARSIISLTGKKTRVIFDRTKPSGQLRRCPDTRKAKSLLGFEARVSLKAGLNQTINWYSGQRHPSQISIFQTSQGIH